MKGKRGEQTISSRNRGFPLNISARIHPTDPVDYKGSTLVRLLSQNVTSDDSSDSQTSIAKVYSLKVNMISGARYHLVATYL